MPDSLCPRCQTPTSRRLDFINRWAHVDYYLCEACGHVWTTAKDEPSGAASDVTDPRPHPQSTIGVEFLRTELQMAFTFVEIAASAGHDTEKRNRNRAHAETAYGALVTFLPRVTLPGDEARQVADGIRRLREAIDSLPR